MERGSSRTVNDRKLDSIQLLRALAAVMVVVGHLISAAVHHPEIAMARPYFAGGAGVDIFFLISGFIMVHASQRLFGSADGARDFLIRRLIRIVPLYWMVTFLTLVLLLVGNSLPSISAISASLFFIPFDSTARGDGFAFPIVDLGWTLNYEMMFYVIFAAFLPLGRNRCAIAVLVTLAILVAFGFFTAPDAIALRFWTQPLILEFGAGVGIALLHLRGMLNFSALVRILLIAVAIALYLVDPFGLFMQPITPNSFERLGTWGVASAMMLVAAVSGPMPLDNPAGRMIVILGDASYALYLLHPFVIIVLNRIAGMDLFAGGTEAIIFIVVGFAIASVGSIIFHYLVERPVTAGLTHGLQKMGVPVGRVPLPVQS